MKQVLKALRQQMSVQEFVLYDTYISIREGNIPHAIAGLSSLGEEFNDSELNDMLSIYEDTRRGRCFKSERMRIRKDLLRVTTLLTQRVIDTGNRLNVKIDFTGKEENA